MEILQHVKHRALRLLNLITDLVKFSLAPIMFTMTTNSANCLKNHFLLAMPQMSDTLFQQSLIYICEHDFKGALGLMINQPSNLCWDDLFTQLNISPKQKHTKPVLIGGPVNSDRGI